MHNPEIGQCLELGKRGVASGTRGGWRGVHGEGEGNQGPGGEGRLGLNVKAVVFFDFLVLYANGRGIAGE